MKEHIETGILEKVPEGDSTGRDHYIPHQAVSSESTKLRVLYDCSAKARTGKPSLNDFLESGPPLQPHLFDILMRVRSYKFLVTGTYVKHSIRYAWQSRILMHKGCFGIMIYQTESLKSLGSQE